MNSEQISLSKALPTFCNFVKEPPDQYDDTGRNFLFSFYSFFSALRYLQQHPNDPDGLAQLMTSGKGALKYLLQLMNSGSFDDNAMYNNFVNMVPPSVVEVLNACSTGSDVQNALEGVFNDPNGFNWVVSQLLGFCQSYPYPTKINF